MLNKTIFIGFSALLLISTLGCKKKIERIKDTLKQGNVTVNSLIAQELAQYDALIHV